MLNALKTAKTDTVDGAMQNRFEEIILPIRPGIAATKALLKESGAFAAQMSGSGPSVFGFFEEKESALQAQRALQALGKQAFLCEFV